MKCMVDVVDIVVTDIWLLQLKSWIIFPNGNCIILIFMAKYSEASRESKNGHIVGTLLFDELLKSDRACRYKTVVQNV